MRKIVTLSLVAGAALLVAACGKSETVDANTANVTELNAADATAGTTNDSMANVDAAAGANVADANATAAANTTDANAAAAATNAVDANAAAANAAH